MEEAEDGLREEGQLPRVQPGNRSRPSHKRKAWNSCGRRPPASVWGAMDGAHKGWMAPTMNRGRPQLREMAHERGNPRKKIPTKEDTNERGYPRVVKCQFFYTEQNLQTKFYPKKNV